MNFKRRGFLQAASAILANPKAAVQKTLEAVAASTAAVAPALIDSEYMGQVIARLLNVVNQHTEHVDENSDGSVTVETYNWKTDELENITYSKEQVRSSISQYLLDQYRDGTFTDLFRGITSSHMGEYEINVYQADIKKLDNKYDNIIRKTLDTVVSKVGLRNLVRSFLFDYHREASSKAGDEAWKELHKKITRDDLDGIERLANYYEPLGNILSAVNFNSPSNAIKQLRKVGIVKPLEAHKIEKEYDNREYDDEEGDYYDRGYEDEKKDQVSDKVNNQDLPDQSDPDWYDDNQDDPFMKTKERFHESTKITPEQIARFITEDPRIFNENEREFVQKRQPKEKPSKEKITNEFGQQKRFLRKDHKTKDSTKWYRYYIIRDMGKLNIYDDQNNFWFSMDDDAETAAPKPIFKAVGKKKPDKIKSNIWVKAGAPLSHIIYTFVDEVEDIEKIENGTHQPDRWH